MAMYASDAIERCRALLADSGQRVEHFSATDMYLWIFEGQKRILAMKPYASALHDYQHKCTVGCSQRLPDTAYMVLDIESVTDGDTTRALHRVDRRDADSGTPSWTSERGTPYEYILPVAEEGDTRQFWLLPGPNNATTTVNMVIAKDARKITGAGDQLVVSDDWIYCLVDYCMYRLLSKHNKAGNQEAANLYLRQFVESVNKVPQVDMPPQVEQQRADGIIR